MIQRLCRPATSLLFGAALASTVALSHAAAQEMGQGEAHITARSNVQMEVQSGPGTTRQKLTDMSGPLGGVLGRVRDCYARILREHPTVQGRMKVRVSVEGGGRSSAEVTLDEVGHAPLSRCVLDAARHADFSGVRPPASADLGLDFTNTAAEGVERMNARSAEVAHVEVSRDADGHPVAGFGTPGGEVRFEVTGQGRTSAETVVSVVSDLRAHVAEMLDCRRRATRSGSDPSGELAYHLWIPPHGRARTRQTTNTVAHAVGGRCMSAALGRASFASDSAGHVMVRIHFAPLQPTQGAEESDATGERAAPPPTTSGQAAH